jgi:hypothetical protein
MEKKQFAEIRTMIFRPGVSRHLVKTHIDAQPELRKNATTATVIYLFVRKTSAENSKAVLQ